MELGLTSILFASLPEAFLVVSEYLVSLVCMYIPFSR